MRTTDALPVFITLAGVFGILCQPLYAQSSDPGGSSATGKAITIDGGSKVTMDGGKMTVDGGKVTVEDGSKKVTIDGSKKITVDAGKLITDGEVVPVSAVEHERDHQFLLYLFIGCATIGTIIAFVVWRSMPPAKPKTGTK